jgi:predicted CDP-diglyceride synthetase/phosphatidate cytidylyltransferase
LGSFHGNIIFTAESVHLEYEAASLDKRFPTFRRSHFLHLQGFVGPILFSAVSKTKRSLSRANVNISPKRKFEKLSRNHCCRGKAISITYSECVSVALVIQHAKRMRLVILSFVACLALQNFSTLSHKRHDFRKNVIENKMCVLIFSTSFVSNISHSKENSATYYHTCTYVFMPQATLNLSTTLVFLKLHVKNTNYEASHSKPPM